MFAGHIGAALAIGRVERRINVGAFVVAALLLDILLWVFVLLGWETVTIPADFVATHQLQFAFPWSHGLLGSIAWSALAGLVTLLCYQEIPQMKLRAAALVVAAVFSHWLLDALVHRPELPIAGAGSVKIGLGLWQQLPTGLALEAVITVAGLYYFLTGTNLSRPKRMWLAILSLLVLVFTVAGMTLAPPPPSAAAVAASSLVTLIAVCALASWLGRTNASRS